jgi:hypothetical protein
MGEQPFAHVYVRFAIFTERSIRRQPSYYAP